MPMVTLNVVFTMDTSNLVSDIDANYPALCDHIGRLTHDHFTVAKLVRCWKTIPSRNYAPLTLIVLNEIMVHLPILSLYGYVGNAYSVGLKSLVSAHTPLQTTVQRPGCPW